MGPLSIEKHRKIQTNAAIASNDDDNYDEDDDDVDETLCECQYLTAWNNNLILIILCRGNWKV